MRKKEFLEFKLEITQAFEKNMNNVDKLIEIVGKNVENINFIMETLRLERRIEKLEKKMENR